MLLVGYQCKAQMPEKQKFYDMDGSLINTEEEEDIRERANREDTFKEMEREEELDREPASKSCKYDLILISPGVYQLQRECK